MILKLSDLRKREHERPAGYYKHLVSLGTVRGDILDIPDDVYQEQVQNYRHGPPLRELVKNFTGAVTRWVKAGAPIADRATFNRRLATCNACPEWDKKHHRCLKCGCYRLKHWMGSEKCPAGKWN